MTSAPSLSSPALAARRPADALDAARAGQGPADALSLLWSEVQRALGNELLQRLLRGELRDELGQTILILAEVAGETGLDVTDYLPWRASLSWQSWLSPYVQVIASAAADEIAPGWLDSTPAMTPLGVESAAAPDLGAPTGAPGLDAGAAQDGATLSPAGAGAMPEDEGFEAWFHGLIDQAGSGRSPTDDERAFLQRVHGQDPGDLRIHEGPAARRASTAIQARAFTVGEHVFLGGGAPLSSAEGAELLAHEATHVLQHRAGRVPRARGGLEVSVPSQPHEQEAEAVGRAGREVYLEALSEADPPEPWTTDPALLEASARWGLDPGLASDPAGRAIAARVLERLPAAAPEGAEGTEEATVSRSAEDQAPSATELREDLAWSSQDAPEANEEGAGTTQESEGNERSAETTEGPEVEEPAADEEAPAQENHEPELSPPSLDSQPKVESPGQDEGQEQPPAAGGAVGVLERFAAEAPSAQARQWARLGADAGAAMRQEEEAAQGQVLPLEAAVAGADQIPEPGAFKPVEVDPELLEAPPREGVAIPSAVTDPDHAHDAYERRPVKGADLGKDATDEQRGRQVAEALGDIRTRDPGTRTDPGQAPTIPATGEADPARVAEAVTRGATTSADLVAQARAAIAAGPGSAGLQVLGAELSLPVAGMALPEAPKTVALPSLEEFAAIQLGPEVTAAFDQRQRGAIQGLLAPARQGLAAAGTARDDAREEASAGVRSAVDNARESALSNQESALDTWRDTIDEQREGAATATGQLDQRLRERAAEEQRARRAEMDRTLTEGQGRIEATFQAASRDAEALVAEGEAEAEAERAAAQKEADEQSWWSRAWSWIQSAIQAVVDLVADIFARVQAEVTALLDEAWEGARKLLSDAIDALSAIADAFDRWVERQVGALVAALDAWTTALGEVVADAYKQARAAVDELIEGLEAQVASLAGALVDLWDASTAAFSEAVDASLATAKAALEQGFSGVFSKLLAAAAAAAGLPVAEIQQVFDQGVETVKAILKSPGAFFSNLVGAVTGGIARFAENLGTHLPKGLMRWLGGALQGVTVPETLDVSSVFGLAAEVLGLTAEGLRAIAVKALGQENVERAEALLGYVQTLVTGGFQALYAELSEHVSDLKDVVLGQVQTFIQGRIIQAAVAKIASLFVPGGAVLTVVSAAWKLIGFLKDQLASLAGLAGKVIGAVSQIAKGDLSGAKEGVEGALAGALPLALDALARLLGLGDVGGAVRGLIEGVRARVEGAFLAVIERLKGVFGLGGARGDRAAEPADGGETLGPVETFTAGAETHRLWISAEGTLMVASTPMPVLRRVEAWSAIGDALPEEAKGKLARARAAAEAIQKVAKPFTTRKQKDGKPAAQDQDTLAELETRKDEIAVLLGELFELCFGLLTEAEIRDLITGLSAELYAKLAKGSPVPRDEDSGAFNLSKAEDALKYSQKDAGELYQEKLETSKIKYNHKMGESDQTTPIYHQGFNQLPDNPSADKVNKAANKGLVGEKMSTYPAFADRLRAASKELGIDEQELFRRYNEYQLHGKLDSESAGALEPLFGELKLLTIGHETRRMPESVVSAVMTTNNVEHGVESIGDAYNEGLYPPSAEGAVNTSRTLNKSLEKAKADPDAKNRSLDNTNKALSQTKEGEEPTVGNAALRRAAYLLAEKETFVRWVESEMLRDPEEIKAAVGKQKGEVQAVLRARMTALIKERLGVDL